MPSGRKASQTRASTTALALFFLKTHCGCEQGCDSTGASSATVTISTRPSTGAAITKPRRMLLWPACTSFSVIVLDRSAHLHIDPTVLHDWDQYFQFGPPGFDQRERSSYTNCRFYRDTHSRRDEWKKRVLLSPEHWHS